MDYAVTDRLDADGAYPVSSVNRRSIYRRRVYCLLSALWLSCTSGCQPSSSNSQSNSPSNSATPRADATIPRQNIDDATLAKYRVRWLMAGVPSAQRTPAQVRAELSSAQPLSDDAKPAIAPLQVVVCGKIGAAKHLMEPGSSYPWEPGLASFMIGDPKLSGEKHEHRGGDTACKFCARKARDGSALVRFLDGEKPLAIDSRTLFNVREGQDVIVVGTAHLNTLDQLVIDAERLFVAK